LGHEPSSQPFFDGKKCWVFCKVLKSMGETRASNSVQRGLFGYGYEMIWDTYPTYPLGIVAHLCCAFWGEGLFHLHRYLADAIWIEGWREMFFLRYLGSCESSGEFTLVDRVHRFDDQQTRCVW
jgi:hypothetical protein